MPVGWPFASRRISKIENGRRSSGSHAARRLDHDELSRPREPGDLRRVECQHAVVVGEPRVGPDCGVDVARHNPKYTLRVMRFLRMLTNSLLAGALGAAFLTIIVLQLNPSVPLLSATTWRLFVALGALLRRPPRRAVLPADGRARVHRPRRHVARMGERPRPRVADGGVGGSGVGVDVAQRRRVFGRARREQRSGA